MGANFHGSHENVKPPIGQDSKGNRSIPSHVILKLKHEGITAVRGKGRLVADGNFQKNTGEETFAPTPSMTSFRVLNGYAAKHGRHIETGD